ncbi:Os03g0598600 [Oryza sativa Japonica Group]|uniref:Protein FAR1-RELATED SEQUENCE n=1 Tax=Oryza sativa subsp. japonica TaxID=39947 RepID=Q0DQG4_ORYSJ|nr:Os03g0598600 [Oryza sativa Japonica Group]|eukprot:NP_001050610.2 Os03g0598600 [Oryza sativa Japonica Group]
MELEEEKDPPKHQSKIKMNSEEIKKRKIRLGKDQDPEKKEMSGKNIKSIKETGTKGQSKELQKKESKSRKSTKDKSKKNKDMTQVSANAEEFHKEYTTKVIRKESRTDSSSIEQVIGSSSIQEMETNEQVKSKDTSKDMTQVPANAEGIHKEYTTKVNRQESRTGNKDNGQSGRSISLDTKKDVNLKYKDDGLILGKAKIFSKYHSEITYYIFNFYEAGRSISLDTGNKDNKDAERSIQHGNIQNMTQLVLTEHNANTLISGAQNFSYTSLMEQIISSQPSISEVQQEISTESNFVATPRAFQVEDEDLEDNELENWNLDMFNLSNGQNVQNSADNSTEIGNQATTNVDTVESNDLDANGEMLTEEDINNFLEQEQEEATKGNNAAIDAKYIPRVDMQFKSIKEAHDFFNFYALLAGFSVVIAHSYHSTSKKRNGEVIRVTFKCNRHGKAKSESQEEETEETVVAERNNNEIKATSCNCALSKEGLYDEYEDIMNNSVTEEEFEYLWNEMVDSYEVQHIYFLKHMWSIRKRFIPVYFKTNFCPFIKSTALSEGTNSRFKKDVGPQYSIISFLIEYVRVMDTIQNLEQLDDHNSRTKRPSKLWSHYYIEYQAVKLYNSKIFKKFQVELKRTTRLQLIEVEKLKTYEVFLALNQKIKVVRRRKYLVIVDSEKEEYTCICSKFEKDGLLCSHILKIMLHLNIMKIPKKYIIDRWRKKDYKEKYDFEDRIIPLSESSILRFNILSRKCAEIASQGSKSIDSFQFTVDQIDKLEKESISMNSEQRTKQQMEIDKIDTTNGEVIEETEENNEEILIDPDIAKSKGRPSQRYKSFREELQSKEVYHCSYCQRTDHTFPTCPLKHIEFDLPRKKIRKTKNTAQKNAEEEQTDGSKKTNKGKKQEATTQVLMEQKGTKKRKTDG